jgi:outer membrane murein-binding lipoprotein Lpp
MRRLALLALVAAGAATGLAFAGGPNPPTPRVARLQRDVYTLHQQVVQLEQEMQAQFQAVDQLEARVAALELKR